MSLAERIVVGVLLAALALGASAIALTTPGLTRVLVVWSGAPQLADLPADVAIQTAEDVRAYVTGAYEGPLPATVQGRSGFDRTAVSHLDDVARVLSLARLAAAFSAGLLAAWLSISLARRRARALDAGLKSGAIATAVLVALAVMMVLFDFNSLFAAFHGLFFEAGTWEFRPGTLLIELFPERFWMAMGALWGALALAGAVLMFIASRTLLRKGAKDALAISGDDK